ncbi:NRDE family protein [Vreelandella andesensis]|uniref:NRDE family protein n=1 Tax=Vreelandella andesensis TaxID=447567 RepID=A0A433KGG7_9GAMM|nr:NRDE family protein [Halomonas andesensis]RUR27806.1 NRDE family protein [Halomonas andesensis]
MCLITFSWAPGSSIPLRLAGNRDEFHQRPTAPLAYWEEHPTMLGGRDLEAGGTWLAANDQGVIAALTNVRDPLLATPANAPSRGELVASVLQSDDVEAWLNAQESTTAQRYAGFNLLVATPQCMWHLHRGRHGVVLSNVPPGVHGLSNATLNTPWPKLNLVRDALLNSAHEQWQSATQHALHSSHTAPDEQLPDTGVGLTLERQLSSAFIIGEQYGTRATTWLTLNHQGQVEITEQRFGPLGRFEGETILTTPRH